MRSRYSYPHNFYKDSVLSSVAIHAVSFNNPPPLVKQPELPIRPHPGFLGRLAFRLLGHGTFPEPLAPHMAWMLSNGAGNVNDIERIRQAFVAQLGPGWRSFREASPVTKIMMLRAAACFIDKETLKDIDESLVVMLDRPASLARDMADIMKVVRRYEGDARYVEWIDQIGSHHGFERTAIVGAIDHVWRHKGVIGFKDAEMPWLPFVDRTTWIAAYFRGRRIFAPECAGIFSHLLAERSERKAIHEPHVDGAVEGIQRAWRERLVFDPRRGAWVLAANHLSSQLENGND